MQKKVQMMAAVLSCIVFTSQAQCPAALKTFHILDRQEKSACLNDWQIEFFQEVGCPLQFVNTNPSYDKKAQLLRDNQVDVMVGLSQTADRPFQFSQPFAQITYRFYRRADEPQWDAIREVCDGVMRQANIIVPVGGYFGDDVKKMRDQPFCVNALLPSPLGPGDKFDLLAKKRADLLFLSERWYRSLPAAQAKLFRPIPHYRWHDSLHIAFSSKVPADFIKQVNAVIAKRQRAKQPICNLDLVTANERTRPRLSSA